LVYTYSWKDELLTVVEALGFPMLAGVIVGPEVS